MNPEDVAVTENETPTNETEVVTPEVTEQVSNELKSALAQKDHFREKFEKAEAERKALEARLNAPTTSAPLAVEDYIDISTSLDGLDQREKAYLAEQHRLSGKPLKEIRNNEDFALWQSAYRAKQEKENALKPSATQVLEDAPKTLTDRLRSAATLTEKEQILREAGLYKEIKPRSDRTPIGNTRTQ